MSATRANRPGATGRPGNSTHQRWADKVLRERGYSFLRSNSNDHNIYENTAGQRVTVSCTPRNEGNARRLVLNDIAKHNKQRTAMPTNTVSAVDQYLAMADSFLMTPPAKDDTRAVRARYSALTSWCKRVLERHGPVKAADLTAAAARIGYDRNLFNRARINAGAVSYNAGGKPSVWMVCLEHQLPADKRMRARASDHQLIGVVVEQPEPQAAPSEPAPTNGRHELTDQQAAALMLLESVGMKMPGDEAREKLMDAMRALQIAQDAVGQALDALA